MNDERLTLGWREWLGFPELGIEQIKAMDLWLVNTGAELKLSYDLCLIMLFNYMY